MAVHGKNEIVHEMVMKMKMQMRPRRGPETLRVSQSLGDQLKWQPLIRKSC